MLLIGYISGTLYLICMIAMSLYGLNAMVTAILFIRAKRSLKKEQSMPEPKEWPKVTIQLPVFNEKYTLERLLWAVTQLDYPVNRLQIQVLDDSTMTLPCSPRVSWKNCRPRFQHRMMFRTEPAGYKAGALKKELETATGQLVGVFDADLFPLLVKQTVPNFRIRSWVVCKPVGDTPIANNLLTPPRLWP